MKGSHRGIPAVCAAIVAGVVTLTAASPRARRDQLPDRLADSTFWRLVTTFSEQSGVFPSENFVSNETEWQYVIPDLLDRAKDASAYVGVGPEQNFTYIASFHPHIAFICDIRRQNMIVHLMYKALLEMSTDRADFLAKLWSRQRPEGLDTVTSPATILAALRRAKPDSLLYSLNTDAIFGQLVNRHKFALSPEDSATLRAVYGVFFRDGPDISYASSSGRGGLFGSGLIGGRIGPPIIGSNGLPSVGFGGGSSSIMVFNGTTTTSWRITTDSAGRQVVLRDSSGTWVPDTTLKNGNIGNIAGGFAGGINIGPPTGLGNFPGLSGNMGFATFGSLMTLDDGAGQNRGWLGTEAAFQWLKDFEKRNLLVPVVGNFAGPKALRAVGDYLRDHNAHVSAFYTSNVEQYLFQDRINSRFYENVATMPHDANSFFIRSFPSQFRGMIQPRNQGSRLAQTTSSIDTVLRADRGGALYSYNDLARLQDRQ